MSEREERKERVIHTRVPESLDDEIKAKARRLGVSVSNLVRNVLEHTVELVEDIVTDGADIARSAGAPRRAPTAAPAVLGWQRAVLELNAVCDSCNEILPRGTEAAIAVTAGGAAHFRCTPCLEGGHHDA
ncbi:MAG: ribbon-helix-helix protein, CopG family [Deltaproteobacteria bacterium]|nr:ribbon-helix-helix protein, CopG family [Deltaproteobacteria bacterium]MBW2447074.1 ribbon-helix-helix protein, CopG family [Deltaproteobacteria bacterium]